MMMLQPTPTARPLIAAITGFSRLATRGCPPPPQLKAGSFGSSCGASAPFCWNSLRNLTSRPAQKARPLPVRIAT
jgi:hypothetical protein